VLPAAAVAVVPAPPDLPAVLTPEVVVVVPGAFAPAVAVVLGVLAVLPAVPVLPVLPAALLVGVPVVPALGVVSPPAASPPQALSAATVATSSDPPSKFESDLRYIP
jgi:hypothetical protein